MKMRINKIIALALAVCLLFLFVSCGGGNPDGDVLDTRLTVEFVAEEYSQEEIAAAESAALLVIESYMAGGALMGTEREALGEKIKADFLPYIAALPVSGEELSELSAFASLYASGGGSYMPLYEKCLNTLGTERLEDAAYRLVDIWYGFAIEKSESGSDERTELVLRREEMIASGGLTKLIAVLNLVSVADVEADGVFDAYLGFGMSGAELLIVLRYQANYIASLDIGEGDFRLLCELFIGLAPEGLLRDELLLLSEAGAAEALNLIFPELLSLYQAFFTRLTVEDIEATVNGDASALLAALSRCEDELRSLLLAISDADLSTEGEEELIAAAGLIPEYEKFLSDTEAVTAEEALSALTGTDAEAALSAIIGFGRGECPALTFILLNLGGENADS